jgi:NDMA-dependent alcohol dehydrogenase
MLTRAAVLWETPGKWQVQEGELAACGPRDVLVRIEAAGLCHSDDHFATGDTPSTYHPWVGGHEGAGVVTAVGSAVTLVAVGDHVVTIFIPSCGNCRWCASGLGNLCDEGARIMIRGEDGDSFKLHVDGPSGRVGAGQMALLGTWADWAIVPEQSVIKIPEEIPFSSACLLSCCVPTGWGAAENAGGVQAGDVVIVTGTGGIGINAVQASAQLGASHILAVDPAPFKRTKALEFGATEAFANMSEATERANALTNGQGADVAMVCVGVATGEVVGEAYESIRKAGTVVVTSLSNFATTGIPINLLELPLYQKRIQGSLFGAWAPRVAVPRLAELYLTGQLKLDALVTRIYSLEQVNDAAADMHAGEIVRGVFEMKH